MKPTDMELLCGPLPQGRFDTVRDNDDAACWILVAINNTLNSTISPPVVPQTGE